MGEGLDVLDDLLGTGCAQDHGGQRVAQIPHGGHLGQGLPTSGGQFVELTNLLLPGNLKNSKSVIEYLYKTYGDSIYISIMNQYTPMREFDKFPELSCTPSRREYEKLVDYALSLGVKNAFIQDEGVSSGVYIPKFDMEGLN